MLTYESATELLHLNLEEEAELRILSEAASLRLQWRRSQVVVLPHDNILLMFSKNIIKHYSEIFFFFPLGCCYLLVLISRAYCYRVS